MCSRPQYTDLTNMGGTGPYGPMTILFGSVIQSWYISLDIKYGVKRTFHVPKIMVYRFDSYVGGTESGGSMGIIFGSVIKS